MQKYRYNQFFTTLSSSHRLKRDRSAGVFAAHVDVSSHNGFAKPKCTASADKLINQKVSISTSIYQCISSELELPFTSYIVLLRQSHTDRPVLWYVASCVSGGSQHSGHTCLKIAFCYMDSVLISCSWEEKGSLLPRSRRNGMTAKPNIRSQEPSSLFFRIGIGGMALLFLAIIIFGNMIVTGPGILDAISAYYYSPMRNFFIGSLCVLGTLLICYRYQRVDKIAGIVAGLCVIFLAIFPRGPGQKATPLDIWIGRAHWAFSIGFLLTLVFMVLYLFTRSDKDPPQGKHQENWLKTLAERVVRPFKEPFRISNQKNLPRSMAGNFAKILPKRRRNQVYLGCGITMIVFLLLCLVDQLFFSSNSQLESISPVFWCELIPLLAFSVAWIVKGLGILLDKASEMALASEAKSPDVPGNSTLPGSVMGVSSMLATESGDAPDLMSESPSYDQNEQEAPLT